MDKFSIEECKILWFKHAQITPKQKQAIKTELKTMSEIIADVMNYTKEKQSNGREVTVRIHFNSSEIEDECFMLEVNTGGVDWNVDIIRFSDRSVHTVWLVGSIVSEKWSLDSIWEETGYELPDTV